MPGGQDLRRDSFSLSNHAEEDVFGIDEAVMERQRLPPRQLQHLLGSRRERDMTGGRAPAERSGTGDRGAWPGSASRPSRPNPLEGSGPECLLHSTADFVEVDPDRSECVGVSLRGIASLTDDPHDVEAGIVQPHPKAIQRPPSHSGLLTEQSEQEVFRPKVVVTKAAGLVLGKDDDLSGAGREALEHVRYRPRGRKRLPACFLCTACLLTFSS